MDEARVGRTIRAIRIRRGWRQVDLAEAAGVSHATVSRIERGHLEGTPLVTLASVCRALDASLEVSVRWHGGDLERLVNAAHAALHEAYARSMSRHAGWIVLPEVSFNVYGERGVIDVVLWHPERRALVVVELKTEIVDVSELVGSVDRKRRLAPAALRSRGWLPRHVGAWIVIGESAMNRRRFTANRTMLRAAFPSDARTIGAWLDSPDYPVAALTFLSNSRQASTIHGLATRKRVRKSRTRSLRDRPFSTERRRTAERADESR